MTAKKRILNEQRKRVEARRWSENETYRDYLANYMDNFIHQPNPEIIDAYRDGAGSEIPTKYSPTDKRGYRLYHGKEIPAKMQAIHSSSALVCNAFAYWADQPDRTPVQQALGCVAKIRSIAFEEKMPTGLSGIPPHLDVVFYCDGMVHAVESKFSEPYQHEKNEIVMGSKSYDPAEWKANELPNCAELVACINNGKMNGKFRHLSANQLLKHILGLSNNHGKGFELIYLWYEVSGTPASDAHKAEIELFKSFIGNEVGFRSTTYQDLFLSLKEYCAGQHQDYVDKFFRRYLAMGGANCQD